MTLRGSCKIQVELESGQVEKVYLEFGLGSDWVGLPDASTQTQSELKLGWKWPAQGPKPDPTYKYIGPTKPKLRDGSSQVQFNLAKLHT